MSDQPATGSKVKLESASELARADDIRARWRADMGEIAALADRAVPGL